MAVALGQPVTSAKARWQHNYKRAGVPSSQLEGREQEKHEFKPISPVNRDVLKEHIGSTDTGEVGFRGCSRDTIKRKPNLRFGRQQKAYFSFKLRTSKTGVSSSPSLSSSHASILPQQPPRSPPFHLESLHPAWAKNSPPSASCEGGFWSP